MAYVVAIVPARSGSRSVPDKNIKPLLGKPLIAYSIAVGLRTPSIERVIVSTDSETYGNIAREHGAEVPFLRPASLSGDRSTAYEFVRHTLDWMKQEEGSVPALAVLLLPTTPLREVSVIECAIERLRSTPQANGLRSVHEMSESAYKTVELEEGYLKCVCTGSSNLDTINLPRQMYPRTFHPNGYVEVFRSSHVYETGTLFGSQTLGFVTDRAVEVDTPEDFDYLEFQATKSRPVIERLFG